MGGFHGSRSFALKVDDVGISRRGIVQQVVVLAFEVFVEERDRASSDRLALSPGSGGRITRLCWIVNQRAAIGKTDSVES